MLLCKIAKALAADRFRKPKWFFQAGNITLIFIIQHQRTVISLKLDERKSDCSQRAGENVILSGSKLQLLKACMVNQRSITVTQSGGGREGADRRQAQQDQKQRIPQAQKRLTPFNQLCCRRKFSALFWPPQLLLSERNGRAENRSCKTRASSASLCKIIAVSLSHWGNLVEIWRLHKHKYCNYRLNDMVTLICYKSGQIALLF